ncbi:MAG: hypothetical protein AUK47_03420 [Deltaproteobacteria bacterium CG2_30_63_29]|nr:MAG: hypothetical protein AUK47_03420 [Deltaproteobacteria bacterium CG2_30_63_29]
MALHLLFGKLLVDGLTPIGLRPGDAESGGLRFASFGRRGFWRAAERKGIMDEARSSGRT